ncbi:hypothetical protein RRG08_042657 [Elysia crispata]|uniref:GOLD domain-containing protein n=1 Tax=Elysia crispata TaxID=231223 RepID=A0AAE1CK45_9GAST|nr:hypothetical protein RRG08_042657 [Elysia crispata]
MDSFMFCIIVLIALIFNAEAVRFMLASGGRKCLKEEIHKDILVTGEYDIQDNGQRADVTVTDSRGHILASKESATHGKFAFTTEEYDMFEVCVTSKSASGVVAPEREVFLDVKHGIETKNYEEMARSEKLKPLEVELRRLEDLSRSIVDDFAYMRNREEQMRDTNESTHSRVMYFSLFSMLCLLGLATWQVLYLRRYFKAKKLIE